MAGRRRERSSTSSSPTSTPRRMRTGVRGGRCLRRVFGAVAEAEPGGCPAGGWSRRHPLLQAQNPRFNLELACFLPIAVSHCLPYSSVVCDPKSIHMAYKTRTPSGSLGTYRPSAATCWHAGHGYLAVAHRKLSRMWDSRLTEATVAVPFLGMEQVTGSRDQVIARGDSLPPPVSGSPAIPNERPGNGLQDHDAVLYV